MSLDAMFTLELLLGAVVVVVIVAGALYISLRNRQIRRQTGRQEGTADVPVGTAADEAANGVTERTAPHQPPRREFYKSMGLETTEDMKLRLYSLDEYESELGGDSGALSGSGFLAALKAYRMLDDEWHDYNPDKAADVLELTPGDYEVDRERHALLLRRLPPGTPISARDAV
jgi:hypothetical protein